jgi:glycosyltransferase involved in cell wall biosynthesis
LPGQVNLVLAKLITYLEKIYPYIYRDNKIVTESNSSVNDLKKLGFNEKNIIRIPPGVDLALFLPGKKTQYVQLIYFGGLRKYKRPEYALKVYKELYSEIPNLKLIITGEGPLLSTMRDEVKNKNYDIEFLGKVDYKELSEIIRESWINLHFSITEGWGYSILESSASGTPTVALRVPGVVDTIQDNFNGFLVKDIDEFKVKILYIVRNEDLFIKNSRKFAENFTWDKTVEMWSILLKDGSMKN